MEKFSVMLSEKGKQLYVNDGYKFGFHMYLSRDVERWHCVRKNCKSSFKCKNNILIEDRSSLHNHERNEESILYRQAVSNSFKRKGLEDIYKKPSKILYREFKNDFQRLTHYDCFRIRKNMINARKTIQPNIPNNKDDVHNELKGLKLTTNQEQHFLLINDTASNIIVLSTIENLKLLCSKNIIYVDGTFINVSKIFTQMFTIYTIHNNLYVPLIFCLLKDKYTQTYTHIFQLLVEECIKVNLILKPQFIHADVKKEIHSAALLTWPEIIIRGCRFHIAQRWWRKIQTLELNNEYEQNSELGKYLKYFFGLPFLSSEEVAVCFVEDLMSIQPNDQRIREFTDYIFDNYISLDAVFPPNIWSDSKPSITITTNVIESFHAHIKSKFCSAKPYLHQILEVLKTELIDDTKKRGEQNKRGKKISKDNFFEEKIMDKMMGKINRFDFVKALSFKCLPTM